VLAPDQKHSEAQFEATHEAHVVHVPSVQHIASHIAALPTPPMSVQLWKHMRPLAHGASARQFWVSWQQSPTMHWLHGVPPGSSKQLPASTAMPQCPLAHTRPTQHCAVAEQFEPVGRHMPVPQTPLSHALSQHSLACMHGKPSSLHMFMPHRPPLHAAVQQSLGCVQAKPSGEHMPKPHVLPVGLQKPVQHWVSVMQGSPSGRHIPPPQMFPTGLQNPVQHWASVVQELPSGMHMFGPQMLVTWLQESLQQSLSTVQNEPSGEHPMPHEPALQVPVQQSEGEKHDAPSWRQVWQTPPSVMSQRFVQHSSFAEQVEPVGSHVVVLHTPVPQFDEQHWLFAEQLLPSGKHSVCMQTPPWQEELQQSIDPPQAAPGGRHALMPQTPAVQACVQHWVAFWQTFPSGWQVLPQTPPMQSMSQQSVDSTHGAACGLHCPSPQ
jgi:hypothetical protein